MLSRFKEDFIFIFLTNWKSDLIRAQTQKVNLPSKRRGTEVSFMFCRTPSTRSFKNFVEICRFPILSMKDSGIVDVGLRSLKMRTPFCTSSRALESLQSVCWMVDVWKTRSGDARITFGVETNIFRRVNSCSNLMYFAEASAKLWETLVCWLYVNNSVYDIYRDRKSSDKAKPDSSNMIPLWSSRVVRSEWWFDTDRRNSGREPYNREK